MITQNDLIDLLEKLDSTMVPENHPDRDEAMYQLNRLYEVAITLGETLFPDE